MCSYYLNLYKVRFIEYNIIVFSSLVLLYYYYDEEGAQQSIEHLTLLDYCITYPHLL